MSVSAIFIVTIYCAVTLYSINLTYHFKKHLAKQSKIFSLTV